MTVVSPSQFNGPPGRFGKAHPLAGIVPKDALVADVIVFRRAAQSFGGDLLELFTCIQACCQGCSRHGVDGLAASGNAAPGQVLARIPPGYLANLPGHVHGVGHHPLHVAEGLRAKVADTGVETEAAFGSDDKQSVKTDGPGNETARGHADASPNRALGQGWASAARLPAERLGSSVKGLLDKGAGRGVEGTVRFGRADRGTAFGGVNAAYGQRVEVETASRFGQDWPHHGADLKSARRGLGPSSRSIGEHCRPPPAHGFRLVEQRPHAPGSGGIVLLLIGSVIHNDEQVQSQQTAFLGKTGLHATDHARSSPADRLLVFARDAQHHRGASFFRQKRRNNHSHRSGDLAAEGATGVFADKHNVVNIHIEPFGDGRYGLNGALGADREVEFAVFPPGQGRTGFQGLMADVGGDKGFVQDQLRLR